jgi:hypothetical protein
MTPDLPPPPPSTKPSTPSSRWNRIVYAFAVVGLLSVLALATVVLRAIGVIRWDIAMVMSDSDEAPIRVRNGSLELTILGSQEWQQIGSSANWRIANASRYRDDFEVTIAVRSGSTCGGSLTATGSDVVLTYENDDNPATNSTSRIVLQAQGRRTLVRPESPATLTRDDQSASTLRYQASAGYLKSIGVGNGANPAIICSFSGREQLDHMLIMNVP